MVQAKLRGKYRGLSNEELLDKAYELGFNFEKNSQSCSQCTVAAIHELIDMEDVVVRMANSLCGGSALQFLGTCGGLAGGIIVLDYYFGRPAEHMSHQEFVQANIDEMFAASEAPRLLAEKYWNEYGTIICVQIQRQLFGRFYYALDPDEMSKLVKASAHSYPKNCCHIVGNAARWTMETLLNKGAVNV